MFKKLFVFLLALAGLFLIVGCGTTDTAETTETKTLEEELVGTWESTKDDVKETYTFNEDGTYEVTTEADEGTDKASGSNQSGNWSLEGDELTLETTSVAGEVADVATEEDATTDETMDETATDETTTDETTLDDETLDIPNEPYVCTITIDGDTLTMDGGDTGTYTYTRVTK